MIQVRPVKFDEDIASLSLLQFDMTAWVKAGTREEVGEPLFVFQCWYLRSFLYRHRYRLH